MRTLRCGVVAVAVGVRTEGPLYTRLRRRHRLPPPDRQHLVVPEVPKVAKDGVGERHRTVRAGDGEPEVVEVIDAVSEPVRSSVIVRRGTDTEQVFLK